MKRILSLIICMLMLSLCFMTVNAETSDSSGNYSSNDTSSRESTPDAASGSAFSEYSSSQVSVPEITSDNSSEEIVEDLPKYELKEVLEDGTIIEYENEEEYRSLNNAKITKPYTKEEIESAEKALENIMKSLYLDETDEAYKSIKEGENKKGTFETRLYDITPDLETITPIYCSDMEKWAKSGDLEISLYITEDGVKYYELLMKNAKTGEFAGEMFIDTDGEKWYPGGYAYLKSPYASKDLRTHSVKFYNELKKTKLNLEKTEAKLLLFGDLGWMYYFTDGKYEYLSPADTITDISPLFDLQTPSYLPDVGYYIHMYEISELREITNKHIKIVEYYMEKYMKDRDPSQIPDVGGSIIEYGKARDEENGDPFPVFDKNGNIITGNSIENSEKNEIILIACICVGVVVAGTGVIIIVKKRKAR